MTTSPDHPAAGSTELLYALQRFTVETERFIDSLSRKHGMHRTDLNALNVLVEAERTGRSATPGTLGAELRLSSPATTALIDRLERAGHLRRRRSPSDRRRVELETSDTARATGSAIFGPLAQELQKVISTHSPADVQLLSQFARELAEAVARARVAGDSEPSERPAHQ